MGKADSSKCVFPLTSLQIGDLQSYLSDLSLFIAFESRKLYILVDNRPWLRNLGSHPAHLWQLMVTKSRLSPFANTKAKRGRKEGNVASSQSNPSKSKKFERWFSLIEVATLSRKKGLPHVNKLRNSLLLSSELHRTLYGFIVFEVAWKDVRGINYLNELQTDTSLAIEAKTMRRWEFDNFLDSAIGDTFYDTEENFPMTSSFDDDEDDNMWVQDNSSYCLSGSFDACPGTLDDTAIDCYTEETQGGHEDLIDSSDTDASDCENAIEAKQYRDVLILFRFNDHDLPFKLRQVVMSDLRLLTLLEAGLPSWVIFLQSYPGFCHLYRPWMCPLARALYVIISIITVLIGFYDLYKNVPVLKATASSLCGPLFDWIETWEMVSRIKYLGTMLFLHNFEKAVTWFLMVTRTTRSFFSVFTQPLVEPLAEILGFLLPAWNMFIEVADSLYSFVWVVIESSSSVLGDLIEIFAWPLWFIWSIAISIIYPIFWTVWEILYAPIRLVLSLAGFVAFTCTWISEMIGDIWQSVSGIFQLASVSEATVSTYEVSVWRSLWNDLFSQVFRAVRSILNGFVAFFTACNRHRLSIYNHMQDFIQRLLGQAPRSQPSDYRNSRVTPENRSLLSEGSRKIHIR
ncbi:hypothetical protein OIU74_008166 [Salix koriyanagi]|uniref:Uncharacterized protein n=1 Tax=Salix koriyanagi TaxID=2511006 RepID=A0A9Q0U5B6_9ROSI|nr:hypothetical protein OIU74_008166 [Salix koriyanagi]